MTSELLAVGDLISQIMTSPVLVPTAMYRPRCPGISKCEVGCFMCGSGDDIVEEPAELPDIPRRGSSSAVTVAYVDKSKALVVTWIDFRSPKTKSEIRHSVFEAEKTGSLKRLDALDGGILSDFSETVGVVEPPNKDEEALPKGG